MRRRPEPRRHLSVTETGSLLANKLRIVDTLLESTTRLMRARRGRIRERRKIEDMALMLSGALG
jgi:ATP phosphoribosyltransferase